MEAATAAAFTNESRTISGTETHNRFSEPDVTTSMQPTYLPFKLAKQSERDLDYKQAEALVGQACHAPSILVGADGDLVISEETPSKPHRDGQ